MPPETASAIREFVSSDVLKACIASLHEPYFVDLQKELGSLIASILACYCPVTSTPRQVLVSFANIREQDADTTIEYLSRPGLHTRQQRALVLDLLKDLKGVSISEMGKLSKTAGMRAEGSRSSKRSLRSKMAQEFSTSMEHPALLPRDGTSVARRRGDLGWLSYSCLVARQRTGERKGGFANTPCPT